MIFDELGFPRDTGATDMNDSARLAGIMTVFGYPHKVYMSRYVVETTKGRVYKRHPVNSDYDMSRDQSIPLVAGLRVQGYFHLVSRKYVDGRDIFSPSHYGHVRICRGLRPRFYQSWWLWLDVLWSCFVKPMAEPNQLLCMLMVTDKKYLRFWVKHNKQWKESITEYWNGWRGEPELSSHMIKVIEERAK
jgi:hypothetical protein